MPNPNFQSLPRRSFAQAASTHGFQAFNNERIVLWRLDPLTGEVIDKGKRWQRELWGGANLPLSDNAGNIFTYLVKLDYQSISTGTFYRCSIDSDNQLTWCIENTVDFLNKATFVDSKIIAIGTNTSSPIYITDKATGVIDTITSMTFSVEDFGFDSDVWEFYSYGTLALFNPPYAIVTDGSDLWFIGPYVYLKTKTTIYDMAVVWAYKYDVSSKSVTDFKSRITLSDGHISVNQAATNYKLPGGGFAILDGYLYHFYNSLPARTPFPIVPDDEDREDFSQAHNLGLWHRYNSIYDTGAASYTGTPFGYVDADHNIEDPSIYGSSYVIIYDEIMYKLESGHNAVVYAYNKNGDELWNTLETISDTTIYAEHSKRAHIRAIVHDGTYLCVLGRDWNI